MTTNTNSNNNANETKDIFEGKRKGYGRIAGYVATAAAAGLSLYSGKDPVSVVAGAGVGAAYSHLVGGLADSVSQFVDTPAKVCLAALVAAGSFGITANVVATCDYLMHSDDAKEFNGIIEDATGMSSDSLF